MIARSRRFKHVNRLLHVFQLLVQLYYCLRILLSFIEDFIGKFSEVFFVNPHKRNNLRIVIFLLYNLVDLRDEVGNLLLLLLSKLLFFLDRGFEVFDLQIALSCVVQLALNLD